MYAGRLPSSSRPVTRRYLIPAVIACTRITTTNMVVSKKIAVAPSTAIVARSSDVTASLVCGLLVVRESVAEPPKLFARLVAQVAHLQADSVNLVTDFDPEVGHLAA